MQRGLTLARCGVIPISGSVSIGNSLGQRERVGSRSSSYRVFRADFFLTPRTRTPYPVEVVLGENHSGNHASPYFSQAICCDIP